MRSKNKACILMLILITIFLVMTNAAFALDWADMWTNGAGTSLWSTPGNWDLGHAPTAIDTAYLSFSNNVCRIDSAATCRNTAGPGQDAGNVNCNLDIVPGGSLTVTTTNWSESLLIGYQGQGSLNMYGGSVNVQTVQTMVGGLVGSSGTILMQGGSFRTGGALYLNRWGNGGKARVYANGGTMDLGWLWLEGDAKLDITGCVIKIRYNMLSTNEIQRYIAAGFITAYGGAGTVRYDYNVTNAGCTTLWAEDTGGVIGGGTVWNVRDSFSDNSSSKGVWSYGICVNGVAGDFWPCETLINPYTGYDGLQTGLKARNRASMDNMVVLNTSGAVSNYLQPGQIGLKPGGVTGAYGWRATLVRWRSPGNGTVRVQCQFGVGDPSTYAGHIVQQIRADNCGHINHFVNWNGYAADSFDRMINVQAGDQLNFIAARSDPNPSAYDIVPFDCTITAQAGFGQVSGWDIVSDFSTTQNPGGQWSYGYGLLQLHDADQFIPYPRVSTDPNEVIAGTTGWTDFWKASVMRRTVIDSNGWVTPGIAPNGKGTIPVLSLYGVSTSRVAVTGSGGFAGDLDSAARWTSPGDGTVIVSGCFGPGYLSGGGDAWIIKNGLTVIEVNTPVPFTDCGMPFGFEVNVNEGDTLDFVAGAGGADPNVALTLQCTVYPKYGQFTAYDRSVEAHTPSPADGADGASKYPILTWSAGNGAGSHDVYFGTSSSAVGNDVRPVADLDKNGTVGFEDLDYLVVNWLQTCVGCADFDDSGKVDFVDFSEFAVQWRQAAGVSYKGNVVAAQYMPAGPLTIGQTYYWRVDEVSGLDICKGQVWSFTVNNAVEANEAVLHNPDMGWVLQDVYPTSQIDSSMVLEPNYDFDDVDSITILFTWSDIESSLGSYNFAGTDTVYDYWKAKGKKITLRLASETWLWWNNYVPPTGLGVPQYVLDVLPGGSKQVLNNSGINYTVVDAREPYYLTRLGAFLNQVAAHFDPNGARPVDVVDLGGFGLWGEWHSGFAYPNDAARRTALMGIIDAYSNAFAHHTLALSYSHDPAGPSSYYAGPVTHYDPAYTTTYNSYLNYSTFDYALTKPNITLRRNGCAGTISSNERKLAYDTFAGLNKGPFTSEFNGDFVAFAKYTSGGFTSDMALNDALDLHPNYMLAMGWDQHRAKFFIKSRPDLVASGMRQMGYRFVPTTVTVSETVNFGQNITYNISWINEAVGRAMRNYELRFVIRDLNGAIVGSEYNAGAIGTSTWIKGQAPHATSGSIPNSLAAGTYRLCVSMFDTKTSSRIQLPLVNNFDDTYEIAIVKVQ